MVLHRRALPRRSLFHSLFIIRSTSSVSRVTSTTTKSLLRFSMLLRPISVLKLPLPLHSPLLLHPLQSPPSPSLSSSSTPSNLFSQVPSTAIVSTSTSTSRPSKATPVSSKIPRAALKPVVVSGAEAS